MKTAELRDKHAGYWENHPDYPANDWADAVANKDTRLGYWAWVAAQIEQEPDLKDYTVFGFYTDSMQRYCDHVRAISPEHAETVAACGVCESTQIAIVGVIEGHHQCKDTATQMTVRDGLLPAGKEVNDG